MCSGGLFEKGPEGKSGAIWLGVRRVSAQSIPGRKRKSKGPEAGALGAEGPCRAGAGEVAERRLWN